MPSRTVTDGDIIVPGARTFSLAIPCVDLRAHFGARYKIRKEADAVTWSTTPESERVWLLEIPCKHGVVYPQGGDILAATITSRIMGRRVAALPGILSSRGDTERVVKFHVDDAEAVLAILKPKPVYRMSEAQRLQLAAARAKSPLRLGREGDRARGGEAETGSGIEAEPKTNHGYPPKPSDAEKQAGAEQPRSRRALRGSSS